MNASKYYHIKLRKRPSKRFAFLSGKGGLNYLRIHAAIFEDKAKAETVLAEILRDNPEYDGRISE